MGVPKLKLNLQLILLSTIFLPLSTQHPDDESCLTHLFNSFQDPNKSLQNWTTLAFSYPCSDFTSNLLGATCNNARIYKLSLRSLGLHGAISPYISNCTNLQSLDLSNNSLTGPLPDDLHRLLNLAVLNLSSNRLSGAIPDSLPMCLYLNVIDLHGNLFEGIIPNQIGSLVRLTVFDVSENKLSGVIPGNLGRFNVSSYVGNKGLYGYPLGPRKSGGLSVLAIVGIGLGSGLVSLGFSFTVVCVWLRAQEKKRAKEEQEGKISLPDY